MAEASNNTTSLGVGVRSGIKSQTGREISSAISKVNYNYAVKNDAKMEKFAETVYKMVSTWPVEDRMAILSQYGGRPDLGKNPSDKDINSALTETLIINLPQHELQQLMEDVRVTENRLAKDVRTINQKNRNNGNLRTGLNTKNFNDIYEKYKDMSQKNHIKMLKNEFGKSFKLPKYIKGHYSKLVKELKEVLNTIFNRVELENFAFKMDIISDDGNIERLKNNIINKILLYVDLIIGKSKVSLGGAFGDTEPYEEILQYTSYSYVTGKPGLDPNVWASLKKEAQIAKKQIALLTNLKNKKARRSSSAFKAIAGSSRNAKELNSYDDGVLQNASYDDLIRLAGRYGIDPTKMSVGKLKLKIYQGMANENRLITKTNKSISIARNKGSAYTAYTMNQLNSIYSKNGGLDNLNGLRSTMSSGGIPLVKLDNETLLTPDIKEAVPVYLVGSYGGMINGTNGTGRVGLGSTILSKPRSVLDSSNITNESQLPEKQLAVYRTILAASKEDLEKIKKDLKNKYFVKSEILSGITALDDYEYRKALLWIYADCHRMRELKGFMESLGAIRQSSNYKSKIKKFGKDFLIGLAAPVGIGVIGALAATNPVGALGAAGIIGTAAVIRAGVSKFISLSKRDKSDFNTLTISDQKFYLELSNYPIGRLSQIAGERLSPKYPLNLQILANTKLSTSEKKDALIYIEAYANNRRELCKYIEINNSEKINFKEIRENISVFNTRLNHISRFANKVFGKRTPVQTRKFTSNVETAVPETTNVGVRQELAVPALNKELLATGTNALTQTESLLGRAKTITDIKPIKLDSGVGISDRISGRRTVFKNDTGIFAGLDETNPFVADVSNIKQALQSESAIKNGKKNGSNPLAIRVFDESSIIYSKLNDQNKTKLTTDEALSAGIKGVRQELAVPAYLVNPPRDKTYEWLSSNLPTLLAGFSSDIVSAPMGVGAITRPMLAVSTGIMKAEEAVATVKETAEALKKAATVSTGGIVSRFATGGTAAITGDASGSNIFANGAKPELVQSSGSMTVTPLNKTGTEQKQKVSRMTLSERSQALATAISSHVVRVKYTLDSNTEDISNIGEAIKVYNVKPGINDEVDLGGTKTSLMTLLGNIYAQLTQIVTASQANTQLLGTVATNTVPQQQTSSASGNPFVGGFPDSLNAILQGQ